MQVVLQGHKSYNNQKLVFFECARFDFRLGVTGVVFIPFNVRIYKYA